MNDIAPEEPPFGPEWRLERTLRDGTLLTLRPVVPEDRAEVARAIAHLSPETRMRRFLTAVVEPSESVLRYLTCVDQKDHVAIAATVPSPDLKEEHGVGIARFVRLKDDHEAAEAAITVVDEWQHRGVGRELLTALARVAWSLGVRRFRAEVLASNLPIRAILEQVGAREVDHVGDVVVFEVDLDEPHPETGLARLQELLRAAAASMAGLIRRMMPDSALLGAAPATTEEGHAEGEEGPERPE